MANGHGGYRPGAGRKPKQVEEQAKELMKRALMSLYGSEDSETAKLEFLKEYAQTSRGQQFIAEHLFGKPVEVIENHNIEVDTIDLSKLDNATLEALDKAYTTNTTQ